MHARNSLLTLMGCLFLLLMPMSVQAQDENAGDLALHLAALQTMNRTVGPMIAQAHTRNTQMKAFIQQKGLTSEFATYRQSASKPQELSFDEGYTIALQRAKAEQHTAVSNESTADLADDISATKTMVKSEWAEYSTAHMENNVMTAFIKSKNMMPDYDSFCEQFSKQRAVAIQKEVNAQNEKESNAARRIHAQFKAQQRYLMQHWDQEMHLKGLADSSGYIQSRNRQSVVADSHEYPYLDSQTQPVLWAPQGGGYWGGDWQGGYSDPYYDVWGYPNGGPTPPAGKPYDVHPAYHRTVPPNFHPGALRSVPSTGAGGKKAR